MGAAGVIIEGKAVKGSHPFGITVAPNGDPLVRHDGRDQDRHTAAALGLPAHCAAPKL
jgi:hypothetical protein